MAKSEPSVQYKISISTPYTHYADVSVEIENYRNDQLSVSMPVWTPGSYLIREFERNVQEVKAELNGKPLQIEQKSKNTWTVAGVTGGKVAIGYRVYAFENTVRTSFIDADEAFLHLSSMLMRVNGLEQNGGTLALSYPEQWNAISTTLDAGGKNMYRFNNYDELIDSPIEIGNHEILQFEVAGVPHEIAMVGPGNYNREVFTKDLRHMCETMAAIIGEHPCSKYLFIIKNVESGGGGLEHANSCTVMFPRWNWTDEVKYKSFLGLCAHEYFHLWNVKRLRPVELGPFDYDCENYTEQLWIAEGITSYYDELSMLRAGHIDAQTFTNNLFSYINKVENRPGTRVQSLAQSSRNAWIKEYRPDENSINTSISYYSKGLVAAAVLDAAICSATTGKKNLDDLMKFLYDEFYKKKNRGFSVEEFYQSVSTVAGKSMDDLLNQLIYTTEIPDYGKWLGNAGLNVKSVTTEKYLLGINVNTDNGKTTIREVLSNTPAYHGGLNARDELVSLNGAKISGDPNELLEKLGKPGIVTALIIRQGITREITVDMKPVNQYEFSAEIKQSPGSHSAALKKWLGTE